MLYVPRAKVADEVVQRMCSRGVQDADVLFPQAERPTKDHAEDAETVSKPGPIWLCGDDLRIEGIE